MNGFENLARRKLEAGELVLCMGLRQSRTADIAMMASSCGFDAIYVDMEHSPTTMETTSMLCVAATGQGVTPLVRIPGHGAHIIKQGLGPKAGIAPLPGMGRHADAFTVGGIKPVNEGIYMGGGHGRHVSEAHQCAIHVLR